MKPRRAATVGLSTRVVRRKGGVAPVHRLVLASDGVERTGSAYVRRRAVLGRIHRVEQARLLREAAALLLAGPAAAVAGALVTRVLRLDRAPRGDARLQSPAGLRGRDTFRSGVTGGLDPERWRRRALEALNLARMDRIAVPVELARAVIRFGRASAASREFGRPEKPEPSGRQVRALLARATLLDADPEVEALLAAVELVEGALERSEARARFALARPTLQLASDPERLRGSLELLRALAREQRGRGVAALPALERARIAADEAERAGIDGCALSIALAAGELHVARVAAVRLASADPTVFPALADVVTRRSERRMGSAAIAPPARKLAGRLLASRNEPARVVVLAALRASGRVVARRGSEESA